MRTHHDIIHVEGYVIKRARSADPKESAWLARERDANLAAGRRAHLEEHPSGVAQVWLPFQGWAHQGGPLNVLDDVLDQLDALWEAGLATEIGGHVPPVSSMPERVQGKRALIQADARLDRAVGELCEIGCTHSLAPGAGLVHLEVTPNDILISKTKEVCLVDLETAMVGPKDAAYGALVAMWAHDFAQPHGKHLDKVCARVQHWGTFRYVLAHKLASNLTRLSPGEDNALALAASKTVLNATEARQ